VWARTIAKSLKCHVIVGYPEYCGDTQSSLSAPKPSRSTSRYNSIVLVSPLGDVLANYRKTFLYTTDQSWAEEGPGFYTDAIPGYQQGRMTMGICTSSSSPLVFLKITNAENRPPSPQKLFILILGMDLNPKNFTEPFDKHEFAHHILDTQSDLAILPMAWLTMQSPESIVEHTHVPDAETLQYWIRRLQPVFDCGGSGISDEIIFVACNRSGMEGSDAVYAGTSAIVGISMGNVKVYGCLGRGAEDLLICDVFNNKSLLRRK
jgi:protein N-terminal amidase